MQDGITEGSDATAQQQVYTTCTSISDAKFSINFPSYTSLFALEMLNILDSQCLLAWFNSLDSSIWRDIFRYFNMLKQ